MSGRQASPRVSPVSDCKADVPSLSDSATTAGLNLWSWLTLLSVNVIYVPAFIITTITLVSFKIIWQKLDVEMSHKNASLGYFLKLELLKLSMSRAQKMRSFDELLKSQSLEKWISTLVCTRWNNFMHTWRCKSIRQSRSSDNLHRVQTAPG